MLFRYKFATQKVIPVLGDRPVHFEIVIRAEGEKRAIMQAAEIGKALGLLLTGPL